MGNLYEKMKAGADCMLAVHGGWKAVPEISRLYGLGKKVAIAAMTPMGDPFAE